MLGLKKVSFGTARIQKLRRVALDSNLLNTLGLVEGDDVEVELDVTTETILIRKTSTSKAEKSDPQGSKRGKS